MKKTVKLTPQQARKLALLSQCVSGTGFDRGLKGTQQAIQTLGYVQIDTISVIERAHHHTLWNRVPHYRRRYLDKLVERRAIFEYWSHAAAWLPIEEYRFCLPRMNAIRAGQRHWYKKDQRTMDRVLARIRCDGPLQAKDFEEHSGFIGGMWEWGPVKQAIEHLFMQGDLLVTRRDSFQKVFDLAERVIPAHIDTSTPSKNEYAHHLIEICLKAHGVATTREFGYLRKGMGPALKQAIGEKLETGDMLKVGISKHRADYFVPVDFEQRLSQRLASSRARILSPFDNMVIQRSRIKDLFDFDYQIECYVPAGKRKHGYFVCPILWRGNLVARMDAKANRRQQCFIIRNLHLEPKLNAVDAFSHALASEITRFAAFNQCERIEFEPGLIKRNPVARLVSQYF